MDDLLFLKSISSSLIRESMRKRRGCGTERLFGLRMIFFFFFWREFLELYLKSACARPAQ